MTAIVGVVEGTTIWLGGDSAVEDEDGNLFTQGMSKVFRKGPCVVGPCGHAIWEDAIRALRMPPERGGDYEWLRSAFGDAIRTLELWDDDKSDCAKEESEALIGYRGRIWSLGGDGAIFPLAGKIAACGSGGAAGYGALWALKQSRMKPGRRLRIALEAAESRTPNVRRPFRYCHT